ncbi:MAG: glycogen/starch/alpha-glucan phosphorylase [Zestosphaera sp.]
MYVSVTPEVAVEGLTKFAGGLGVLEGDKLVEARSLGINYAVVTLYHPSGYTSYNVSDADLIEVSDDWILPEGVELDPIIIRVRGGAITVKPFIYEIAGSKLVLLKVTEPQWAVELVKKLYIEKNTEEVFYKYVILSKSVATLIESGVFNPVEEVHLQESFAGMTAFALNDLTNVKFVTHSPGPWAHPLLHRDWLISEFGEERLSICRGNYVNLTECVIRLVPRSYVVSRKQLKVMENIIQGVATKLLDATNGVSLSRWCDKEALNFILSENNNVEGFLRIRSRLKEELINYLKRLGVRKLPDLSTPIITWARRVVKYKRPHFITRFIEENKDLNVFYVLGGRPHPQDTYGRMYAKEFLRLSRKYDNVVYVINYGLEDAKTILRGSDLLLFTPFPGWEASGTSFMKAGVNGTPTLSSRDGAALEMIKDCYNGWLFGRDVSEFIDIYTSVKANEVDEEEYGEFTRKLVSIIKTYVENPNDYAKVSLNAAKSFIRLADVRNTLLRLIR